MKTLYLNVVDSHHEIFHGNISSVTISGTMGNLTILAGHAPLLSTIKLGEIHFLTEEGELETLFVSGGILEVQPTLVTILADTILRSDKSDEKAAQESIERAKNEIKGVKVGSKAYEELVLEMEIMRALINLSRRSSQVKIRRY